MKTFLSYALFLTLCCTACQASSNPQNNADGGEPFKVEDMPAKADACKYGRAGKPGTAVYQSHGDGSYEMRINGKELVMRFNPDTNTEDAGGFAAKMTDIQDDTTTNGGGTARLTVTEIATGKQVLMDLVQDCPI